MTAENFAVEQVHVLRHRFMPSEQLNKAFGEMSQQQPGSTAPRFFLASSRMVAVDMGAFHRDEYEDQLQAARSRLLLDKRTALGFQNASAKHNQAEGTTRIVLTPSLQGEFQRMTNPLARIGVATEPGKGELYHLVVELRQQLVAKEAIERTRAAWGRVLDGIAGASTAHLYTATLHDIVGRDVRRRVMLGAPESADAL